MPRPLDRRLAMHETGLARLVATSGLAVLLAFGAHLTAGGTVVPTADVLLAATALAGSSTWLAGVIGRRTRGMSAAVAVLGAGQSGLELLLWSGGYEVRDPLLAAGLHAGAGLVLAVLVLGIERVAADLLAAADRSFPDFCWSNEPGRAERRRPIAVASRRVDHANTWWPELHPVRGPPLPA